MEWRGWDLNPLLLFMGLYNLKIFKKTEPD
jgi:hypothetical protein